jgi:nonribosomal peptide synthetase DhbF
MVEHRSVVNTLDGNLALYPLDESDVWLQLTSPGFDVAAYEQFMPLLSGGTVVYCSDADRRDRAALTRLLHEHGVTVLVIVPSLLTALGRPDLARVRVLVQAGEPPDVPDTRHFARHRIVVNGYGPTEAAILATTYRIGADDDGARVPIGTALPGTTAHVVDRHGRLAATGVPGELYLGGAGVGRGYWNNPEQTQRLFGPIPALGDEQLYRTGDRVRRLPDGNLDYLGRLDGQIKLRGFRIELGEIEAALASCPGVTAAAAVVSGTGPDAEIFAFVVGSAAPADARDHLQRLLPSPMVPREVVVVPRLPTTSHGKADRKELVRRLPELRPARPAEEPVDMTALERRVLGLWHGLLGPSGIGLNDDFFAVGGHSLRVLELLTLVERELGVRIGARSFLEAPTVRATARRVDQMLAGVGLPDELHVERAEVRLDPTITFTGATPSRTGPVLLTGATGFVGAHLLRELLHRPDDEVLCLVRAASVKAGRDRIREVIHRYRLDVDAGDPRIVPIPGDLALPGLGLTAVARTRLAQRTGAVLHAGAQVHHVSGYGWLAAPNVRGTEELLRLVAEAGPAWFHHVSTLSVFRPGARTITEATSASDERHPRGAGYAASKWAAEQLVDEAAARGASVRVFRLGRAGASIAHGIGDLDDMFARVLVSSAGLGCYPVHPRLDFRVLPVDVMARALVALAHADFPSGTAHHLHPSTGPGLAEYMAAHDRRFSTTTTAVDLDDWVERLGAATALPAAVYLDHMRELSAEPDGVEADTYDNTVTQAALAQLGVQPPDLDATYLERCWDFLRADREAEP